MDWLQAAWAESLRVLRDGGWIADWLQVVGVIIATPLTVIVAVWGANEQARVARKQELKAQAKRDEDLQAAVDNARIDRQVNLAIHLLYCTLRVKWSLEHLINSRMATLRDGRQIIAYVDHYSDVIRQVSAGALHVQKERKDKNGEAGEKDKKDKLPATAPVDDFAAVLLEMKSDVASVLADASPEQMQMAEDRRSFLSALGRFLVAYHKALQEQFARVLLHMDEDALSLFIENQSGLEKAFSPVQSPELPTELIRNLRKTSDLRCRRSPPAAHQPRREPAPS